MRSGDNRICYAVDLKDDVEVIERYKALHMPGGPPARVTASLRDAGISSLEIYLIGNRLFMIMEVDSHYDADRKSQADAHIPEVQAWNAMMATMQQELPFSSSDAAAGRWRRMQRIYDLSSQP
jgi:L-rhamnose mutarotase